VLNPKQEQKGKKGLRRRKGGAGAEEHLKEERRGGEWEEGRKEAT
jgi:hypothetical protein